MNERERVFIVGGAGFIGGHFVDRLLADPGTAAVTIYDNFIRPESHYAHTPSDARLHVVARATPRTCRR